MLTEIYIIKCCFKLLIFIRLYANATDKYVNALKSDISVTKVNSNFFFVLIIPGRLFCHTKPS